MAQTRVQAAMLICKVFLHYLVLLSEWNEMVELWLKILDILDRMMNSGQDQSLVRSFSPISLAMLTILNYFLQEEAIPESLKNILLVMANGGYITRPSEDPSKERLWSETQKRLDRFLPNLFKEVFPDPQSEEPKQETATEAPPVIQAQSEEQESEPSA